MPREAARAYNRRVIEEFRRSGGVVGGELAGTPLLLLTTIGARSGRPRTTPLAYHRRDGRYLVIASDGGAGTDPAWFRNLRACLDVTVEVGAEAFAARATILGGEERGRVFGWIASRAPAAGEFQAQTPRPIPVVALLPVPGHDRIHCSV